MSEALRRRWARTAQTARALERRGLTEPAPYCPETDGFALVLTPEGAAVVDRARRLAGHRAAELRHRAAAARIPWGPRAYWLEVKAIAHWSTWAHRGRPPRQHFAPMVQAWRDHQETLGL